MLDIPGWGRRARHCAGLIGWHFFGGQGEVLKPDGGPVVTVMDFGQDFRSIRSPLAGDIGNSGTGFPESISVRGRGQDRAEHAVRNP